MKLIVISGQILADIQKELNLIKLKTTQLVEKQSSFRKMSQDYEELNKQVKADHRSYLSTHKELTTISHTIEYIKYVCTITPAVSCSLTGYYYVVNVWVYYADVIRQTMVGGVSF